MGSFRNQGPFSGPQYNYGTLMKRIPKGDPSLENCPLIVPLMDPFKEPKRTLLGPFKEP